jgi:predicted transcriptional regulator of viral defense system
LCVTATAPGPNWNRLFETASAQEGYFTTAQADEVGYSPQLLAKYLQNGRVLRARRGVYRLVHFPPGEHEELVTVWLWSEREGVFSHETALALHGLSDVLPARIHLTLPAAWAKRRLRVLAGVVLHHADVAKTERVWVGSVPVTSPRRTLLDARRANISPELVEQATRQALTRGLLTKRDAADLKRAAKP